MDRLNQLRGEAGPSRDSTLDTSSPPSEAYITANENSKYFSLSEDDSTFDISPIKDTTLSSSSIQPQETITEQDRLISNLSPIGKKNDFLDSYKIGKQIEAANILSGGVDIFDDNDNSCDGDELVIDDNAVNEDKGNSELKITEAELKDDNCTEESLVEPEPVPNKDTEVILQIDGKNVDAIDIGNGLYLYRKEGEEELAAVQIDENQQQPSFKFLKVRENAEGNLEVYEEIPIEVPKESPVKEGKSNDKNVSYITTKKVKDASDKEIEKITKKPSDQLTTFNTDIEKISKKDQSDTKIEVNGKLMKISEISSRKSPVVGSFTPMAFHSTPNKEGIPLTKTMVDLQLHPNRHSDNVKKTIEVHTDSSNQKREPLRNLMTDFVDDKNKQETDNKTELFTNEDENKMIAKVSIQDINIKTGESDSVYDNNTAKPLKEIEDTKSGPNVKQTGDDIKNVIELPLTVTNNQDTSNEILPEKENPINHHPILETLNIVEKYNKVNVDNQHHQDSQLKEDKNNKMETNKDGPSNKDDIKNVLKLEFQVNDKEVSMVGVKKSDQKSDLREITCSSDINSEILENKQSTNVNKNLTKIDTKSCDNSKEKGIIGKENPGIDSDAQSDKSMVLSAQTLGKIECKTDSQIKPQNTLLSDISLPQEDINTSEKVDLKLKVTGEILETETHPVGSTGKVVTEHVIAAKKEHKQLLDTANKEPVNIFDAQKTDCYTKSDTIKLDSNKQEIIKAVNTANSHTKELISEDIVKISNKVTAEIVNQAKKEIQPTTVRDEAKTISITVENKLPDNRDHKGSSSKQMKPVSVQSILQNKDVTDKIVVQKDLKSVSNHAAVPFGKWTEANRQAFLNSIKETKAPSNSSNGKQIKNSNDLNRRDFLKKIDTHRQASTNVNANKVQDFGSGNRLSVKKEASVFSNKLVAHETKLPIKTESTSIKSSVTGVSKKVPKQEIVLKPQADATSIQISSDSAASNKKEPSQRKEINNQDLIDKTIEDIINRAAPSKSHEENMKETQSKDSEIAKLDELERKMNELHGIPFIERPPHELPTLKNPVKTYTKSEPEKVSLTKQTKIPNLIPFANKNQQKDIKDNVIDIDSEEEVIEHEPITGDMEVVKNNVTRILLSQTPETVTQITSETSNKEAIITEKDFDKFARRNSISYENCITVNFDSKESPNVVNTIVQKDTALKTYIRQEKYDTKLTVTNEQESQSTITKSIQNMKFNYTRNEDHSGKNYQSKVKMAYQTAMTAKRQLEKPISILEDKPVKVVFVDNNSEIIPRQLNAQGKELSPPKKTLINVDLVSSNNSLDSDILELDDARNPEDFKNKTKHQRKQVLTPVDTSDLELIEPDDLGIEVSPKKKRKTDEKVEKGSKAVVPKKSYLLGRTPATEETLTKSYELPKVINNDSQVQENILSHKNTASAIDNLVKAAELLETQSENILNKRTEINNSEIQQNTPVKRGRGRPRKYPLPEGAPIDKTKLPSPRKKPRLDDTKRSKDSDNDEDSNSDGEMVKENWTMGKINENIVCPICEKLFRSENVVYKHVKHCTGSSPNRSESGSRSPRRFRESQDSESKCESMDTDDYQTVQKDVRKKRKSRDTKPKPLNEDTEVIVIEDTPIKPKPEKRETSKYTDSRKSTISQVNNLVCEFCGKTFRQLSYLVNHKVQHEKAGTKKVAPDIKTIKSVYSCEFCKKEFRQLHHLVQHRNIHSSSSTTATKRKNSSEQNENRISKEQTYSKQNDDASAGFRCEPCDKSFRKLHHLVEHRETHDGKNRQKSSTAAQAPVEKPPPPPQCEICKKTFRKLHHLIEHKEQHIETSSEKSDDKSVKSTLSTKDIIHECSLCYMVFPNEHSLNKHTFICQRKKRQSATKQRTEQIENSDDNKDDVIIETSDVKSDHEVESILPISSQIENNSIQSTQNVIDLSNESHNVNTIENIKEPIEEIKETNVFENEYNKNTLEVIEKETSIVDKDISKISEKPKENVKLNKTPAKDKVAQNITKRHKTNQQATEAKQMKPKESSDDDDVRYMLNPDYKIEKISEEKLFMKVRAKKRNSLQIERPDSKDLFKRRISLQHPPKIPRLKPKSVPTKTVPNLSVLTKSVKPIKLEPVPSTDSDDSDVKYSFPKAVVDKINKLEPSTKEQEKKKSRKSLADKRKSLTSISKKKSLGKVVTPKHKVKALDVNIKLIKKRIAEAEHRCDCGQLFSSAALLSRHTTLAHTPPRIRRRRSPPPELPAAGSKPAPGKPNPPKPRQSEARKSSVKSDGAAPNTKTSLAAPRKSNIPKAETKPLESRKSIKSGVKSTPAKNATKERRNVAHKGVPVPEKMRKYMEKCKK